MLRPNCASQDQGRGRVVQDGNSLDPPPELVRVVWTLQGSRFYPRI